jgi:two-component system OmpR family response regulator
LLAFAFAKAGLDTIEADDGEAALDLVDKQRRSGGARHQHAADGRARDMPAAARRRRPADPVPVVARRRDRSRARHRARRRRLCREAVLAPRSRGAVDGDPARGPRAPPETDEGRRIEHGRLALDPDGWRASWAGIEIALTVTEFSILRTLAVMPAKVFSRDAIIDRLHGPGFAVTDRTIDSHIRNLRAKFAARAAPT